LRYPDWQRRFWAEIYAQRKEPFVWGTRDCVLSAARIADSISDVGYARKAMASFQWANERDAVVLIRSGIRQPVESVMGPMIRWTQLCMGDIALIVDDDDRESLGIHDGAQVIGPDAIGFKVIPFRCVKGGWHVI
jgi:hypothetical protein